MNKSSKVLVAGSRGMAGSVIVRGLTEGDYNNLILRTSSKLDLRNQTTVDKFFSAKKSRYIFSVAAIFFLKWAHYLFGISIDLIPTRINMNGNGFTRAT